MAAVLGIISDKISQTELAFSASLVMNGDRLEPRWRAALYHKRTKLRCRERTGIPSDLQCILSVLLHHAKMDRRDAVLE